MLFRKAMQKAVPCIFSAAMFVSPFSRALLAQTPGISSSDTARAPCSPTVTNSDNYKVTYADGKLTIVLPDSLVIHDRKNGKDGRQTTEFYDSRMAQYVPQGVCPIIGIHSQLFETEYVLYVGLFDKLKPIASLIYAFGRKDGKIMNYPIVTEPRGMLSIRQLTLSDPSVLKITDEKSSEGGEIRKRQRSGR